MSNSKRSRRIGLTNKKLILMVVLAVAVLFVILGACINARSKREVTTMYESMCNTMTSMRHMETSFDSLTKKYTNFDNTDTRMYLESACVYLREKGYTIRTLNTASTMLWEEGELYYLFTDGHMIQGKNATYFGLTEEEIDTLTEEEILRKETQDGDRIYASFKDENNGYLITSWVEDSEDANYLELNILDQCYENAMIIESESGRVLDAKKDSPIQRGTFVEFTEDIRNTEYSEYGITGVAIQADNYVAYGVMAPLKDGRTIVVYEPMSKGIKAIVSVILYPAELLLLFTVLMIIFSAILARNSDKYKALGRNFYLNTGAAPHIVALLFAAGVILMLLSFHLEVLTTYSRQNEIAKVNLESLDKSVVTQREYRDKVESAFENNLTNRAEIINWFLLNCPEILNDNQIAELSKILKLEEISVFNRNGSAIYSDTGYEGYMLSQNEEDDEYAAWKLLREQTTSIIKPLYDGNVYMAAVRRKDDTGIVLIKALAQDLNVMLNSVNVENAIINADFNHAVKIYIDNEKPETMYWLEPHTSRVQVVDNTLSASAMRNNYAGSNKIDGVMYYLNTYDLDDYTLISACRRNELAKAYSGDWFKLVLGYILIMVIIFMYSCVEKGAPGNKESKEADISMTDISFALDTKLRTIFKIVFYIILGVIFATLIFESYVSDDSLLSYISGNVWENGLNVFNITYVVLIALVSALLSIVIGKIVSFMSGNLGPGAVTVGHMIISVLRVVIWVVAVILALYKLGADPRALFTGAGITSVVIGIGAQSTVSDIISGFFLVLEGHVRVGDWITVNGFRGVVTSIGLRTTKISLYGDTISVNNSNMRDIINLSKEPSRIELHFTVDYGTDMNLVRDLINGNSERFMKECPKLTTAPHFENLFEMGTNGLELMAWIYCNEKDRMECKNQTLRTIYEIFTENGVTVPYNVITISNS